jgi:hypothetical protein
VDAILFVLKALRVFTQHSVSNTMTSSGSNRKACTYLIVWLGAPLWQDALPSMDAGVLLHAATC